MAFPRNSLRAFLAHAKTSLRTALSQKQEVTLVIGNESADLDSLTSSIVYAYIKSLRPPPQAFTPLYIPILNIPVDDVHLRPEFATVLRQTNIPISHLITLDDLPPPSDIKTLLPAEKTHWLLVDHNKLQGSFGEVYSSRVCGTIDHHDDERAVPQNTEPEPRIIEKCGSCTSLVVQYLRSSWNNISSASLSSGAGHAQGDSLADDDAVSRKWDAQVAKLALASILIDTRNLSDYGKTKDVDRDAVAYLDAKIKLTEPRTWDRTNYFEEVDAAKQDIDGLSLKDILRKDYKGWQEHDLKLGISSVVKPLEFLAQREDFDTTISAFMSFRDLDIFAIMTTSTDPAGQFQRQLLLQFKRQAQDVVQRFADSAQGELDLQSIANKGTEYTEIEGTYKANKPFDALFNKAVKPSKDGDPQADMGSDAPLRLAWKQGNISASRKQVAPLLREAARSAKVE